MENQDKAARRNRNENGLDAGGLKQISSTLPWALGEGHVSTAKLG